MFGSMLWLLRCDQRKTDCVDYIYILERLTHGWYPQRELSPPHVTVSVSPSAAIRTAKKKIIHTERNVRMVGE
jgi:hypothetical protein